MKKKLLYLLLLFGILFCIRINVNAKEISSGDIEPRTYVIGTHEFTENSTLTTKHIMLASKTIEGNTLNDMIIYYKNPRGKWINGLTGETIEVSEKFNIEYVDTVKYLTSPTLENTLGDETSATLSITTSGYYSDLNNLNEITGWELYEKTTDGYTKVTEGTNYSYEVILTPGETKTFAARVYKLNSMLDRVYSDYSNEIELTRETLNTPTLANDYNDKTKASLSILGAGYYGSSEETLKEISGWELYEKTNNGYAKITEGTNYTYQIGLVPGETKTFVARVYKDKEDGNRIYSEYSNELEVTREKLQTPTLSRDMNYSNLANIAITAEGYYAKDEEVLKEISGWELYEKVDKNYNKIKEGTEYYYTSNEFAPGETKIYVSRVYYETTDGNRIYSEYSNELEVTREKLQTPTLTNDPSDLSGAHLSMLVEGYYASGSDALKEISGWELYEKTDSGYALVTSDSTYSHNVSMEQGTTKTFIARVYYENENVSKTYSEYSNEVVVTIEKIKVPTLTFSKNNDKMTLSIIDEGTYKDETEQNKITGWELYEKGETDTLITSDKPYTYEMDIPYGENKTYYARIYIVDVYDNKVYSENSAELVVNEKLPTPTLSNDYSYTDGAKLSILTAGYYGSNVEKKDMISGWELYEKTESGYSILTEGTNYTYELAMEAGTTKTFVARVYRIINSEKVYSDYSEEITRTILGIPTLSLASTTATTNTLSIIKDGYYSDNSKLNKITKVYYYRVNENNEEELVTECDGSTTCEINIPYGTTEKFISIVYYKDTDSNELYSNKSNVLEITSKIPVPQLQSIIYPDEPNLVGITAYSSNPYNNENVANTITGIEIYKVGNYDNYPTLGIINSKDRIIDYDFGSSEEQEITITSRAFLKKENGETLYSEYTNQFSISVEN